MNRAEARAVEGPEVLGAWAKWRRRGSVALSLWAALALVPSAASAQAQVRVSVVDTAGRPMDGTVTLSGPGRASCRTVAGRCTLSAAAGSYRASVRPVRGSAPAPRSITVPRRGSVTLVMRVNASAPARRVVRPGTVRPVTVRPGTVRPATVRRARPTVAAPHPAVAPRPPYAPRAPVARAPVVRAATPRATVRPGTVRPSPTVRPAGGVRVSPGASPSSRATPSPFAAAARPATAQAGALGRNLGQGTHMCAQGQVLDAAGRPVDATLSFTSGGRSLGQVRTTAGRFSLFDLTPGAYTVSITPTRGSPTRANVNLPAGMARLVFRVR